MLDSIKRLVRQSLDEAKPAAVMFGVVTATAPLAIRIEDRFTVTALIVPSHLSALVAGERVILLRNHGGQQFVVIGRSA